MRTPADKKITIESKQKQRGKTVKLEFNETTLWKTGTIVFGVLFIIAILTGGFGKGNGTDNALPSAPSQAPPQGALPIVKVETPGDSIFKGDTNAPVTIIEFSDFQCPFCGRFYQQTLPQIEKDYIDTGKVKLVYRHLPLSFHEQAQKAAEASECANDQGKFWEYHDMIFENQAALSDAIFSQWAQQLGLDVNTFNDCLDSGKYTSKVNRDNSDAQKYGASGTPTFFINGQKVVGAQPFPAFQAAIDAQLS